MRIAARVRKDILILLWYLWLGSVIDLDCFGIEESKLDWRFLIDEESAGEAF